MPFRSDGHDAGDELHVARYPGRTEGAWLNDDQKKELADVQKQSRAAFSGFNFPGYAEP